MNDIGREEAKGERRVSWSHKLVMNKMNESNVIRKFIEDDAFYEKALFHGMCYLYSFPFGLNL